jgi:predicted nucleotidyltransferase
MLSTLFKTPERIKILETVLQKEKTTVTQITLETGLSKGMVSRYLKIMKEHELLYRKKQTYYITNNTLSKALKVLINLEKLKWEKMSPGWVESAGLYGSWASGTNSELSDVDIWVKVNIYPSEEELNQLYKVLKEMTNSEVNIIVLTTERLEQIKKTDPPFYYSLLTGSLVLEGESL